MRQLFLTLSVIDRSTGAESQHVYSMDERQRSAFEFAVRELAEDAGDAAAFVMAQAFVQFFVMSGRPPRDRSDAWVAAICDAFAGLTADQVARSPRFGCPSGKVEAVVLVLKDERRDELTTIRYDFSPTQRAAYSGALEHMTGIGMSRDEAWTVANRILAALLTGADFGRIEMREHQDDVREVYDAMSMAFGKLTDDVSSLDQATLDDVLRHCTRSQP